MDSIIFDVDGTIWDSRIPVAHAWNAALSDYYGRRIDHDPEFLGRQFGKTMDEIAAVLLPELELEERRRVEELIFERENRWLETEPGTLYPGVAETLEQLSRRLPLYIVSNCQSGYIEVMLKTTGLGPCFSGHLCFGDTGEGKGENLVTLCKQRGLADPVYVGDTQGDADACAQAGIPIIFAAYGLGEIARPWRTIRHFSELLELI